MYHCTVFRLNWPSPRCPRPTLDMRKRALDAILQLANDYELQARRGRMFYVFHAAHYLVELGTGLLESIMSASECCEFGPTHVDGIDGTVLKQTIHIISSLLRNVTKRWPAIQNQLASFDNESAIILSDLKEWADGHRLIRSQYTDKRRKLSQFLLPRPQQHHPDVHYGIPKYLILNGSDEFSIIPTSSRVDDFSNVEYQSENQPLLSILNILN
jgi:hypothetical protein